MKQLQFAAIDIDGVLLSDTFSPVIRRMALQYGGTYDAELERNVFSRPQKEAAAYFIERFQLNYSVPDIMEMFFKEREKLVLRTGAGLMPGVAAFLDIMAESGLKLICYGGLPQSHFEKGLKGLTRYFERYVCTDAFRPGLSQIANDIYSSDIKHFLFIDDVNTVAGEAKRLDAPFIGIPSGQPWCYQREEMKKTGVKYLIDSLTEITSDLLMELDVKAAEGRFWRD